MDIPLLRQDLRLLPGGKDEAGEKEWLLYDPLRHQYFALSRTALLLLRYLPKIGSLAELKTVLSQKDAQVDDHEVAQFLDFIRDNFLVVGSDMAHVQKISLAQEARKTNWFMWLLHNYLFVKIEFGHSYIWKCIYLILKIQAFFLVRRKEYHHIY